MTNPDMYAAGKQLVCVHELIWNKGPLPIVLSLLLSPEDIVEGVVEGTVVESKGLTILTTTEGTVPAIIIDGYPDGHPIVCLGCGKEAFVGMSEAEETEFTEILEELKNPVLETA